MKTVDEVTLVAGQEMSPPPGVVDGTWGLYVFPPTGLLGYQIPISDAGSIIATQIGTAVNLPDRVYQPYVNMPVGSSLVADGSGNFSIISDPYLDGLEYTVFRRDSGEPLIKGEEWQNDVVGGGFRLTQVGAQFESGDKLTLLFKPKISGVISTPDAVARLTLGEQIITADTVAGPSFDRKLIVIQGAAAAAVSYTLNAAYPENVLCPIITGGGQNKQSIVLPPLGQTITRGPVIPRLILGEVDFAFLIRIGSTWRVVNCGDRWKYVGDPKFGGLPGPDKIAANGQTLQISDYPGVDDYVVTLDAALPGSVISVSDWENDKTKWARDPIAGILKVPKMGGWSPRFLDLGAGKDIDRGAAGNIVGSTQASQNKEHNHEEGEYKFILKKDGQGTGIAFDSDPGDIQPNLTSAGELQPDGGYEARPENVGLPALICI